ncbi:sulfotransferase [Phenylobacterium terrae]|uniref:Sulfotransferase n=1 Tax=Phenylobacterium terrae TaxID=2665495 RepID=A0ABW4N3I2_9CAUL
MSGSVEDRGSANPVFSDDPADWADVLRAYLKASSPERFAAAQAAGTLEPSLRQAVDWGRTEGAALDPAELAAKLKALVANIPVTAPVDEGPLGDDPGAWPGELIEHFRRASPERFRIAEQAGRVRPNVEALVAEAKDEWAALPSGDAAARRAFKQRLLGRSDVLSRPVLALKPSRPASAGESADLHLGPGGRTQARSPDFFILGPERSGTTIVGAALSSSPDVFVLNDTMVFLRWISMRHQIAETRRIGEQHGMRADFVPTLPEDPDQPAAMSHVKWLLGMLVSTYYGAGANPAEPNKNLARFALHGDLLDVEQILAAVREGCDWRQVMALVYGSLTPAQFASRRVLGEKTPANVLHHRELRRFHPHARFVCIVRRPETNLASIYRRYPSPELEHALGHYAKFCDAIVDLAESGADCTFIRYEDFTADPAATLSRMAEAVGAPPWPYDPQFRSYNMPEYTGAGVDPSRGENISHIGERERELIRARTREFRALFYPD